MSVWSKFRNFFFSIHLHLSPPLAVRNICGVVLVFSSFWSKFEWKPVEKRKNRLP